MASGRCDFPLREVQGRLASELAFLYGDGYAARGIKVTRRPPKPKR
jgi:hypothetical protein